MVAPLPVGKEWQVLQAGRTITFSIGGFDQGFDTSDIYALISQDRVRSITSQPDGFTVALGCDCRVAPFVAQDRYVVLDITSPGVNRPFPFVSLEKSPSPDLLPAEVQITVPKPQPVKLPIASPELRDIEPLELPILARSPLTKIEQDALDEIQRRLARELGSAATRGVLTPVPRPPLPDSPRPQVDLSDLDIPNASLVEPPLPQMLDGLFNNMRISSSMDIPGLALQTGDPQSVSGLACPINEEVDVANWADDRPFHQQTGDARRLLYQEFDKLDKFVALNLAKNYIYFGFGAEAQQILRLDNELTNSNPLLFDIAQIMETGTAPSTSRLRSLLDCETDIALWAILAREDLDIARAIDPSPALLALNKLPVHLRKFLAPALSRRLLSHGDTDAAATALRNLERLPSELPSAAKFAQANISLDEGDLKKGTDKLEDVIDDNGEQSPEALIALVETQLLAAQPIEPEIANLIEAYAKELKGDELGPELRRAHVLALAKSGQFDRAFDATEELGGDTEDDAAVKLRLRLLEELTAAAGDIVFLEHVFEQSERDIVRLPVRKKMALATRMVNLGFAKHAQGIVASIPSRPRMDDRQLLAARIALDLSQPMRTLAELVEMTGEEADLMRAKAKQLAGSHEEAYALYRAANAPQEAEQAAWLADDWSSLALNENPAFGPILALSEAEAVPSNEIDGMLARNSAALDESAAARETLVNLLSAPEFEVQTSAVIE